jgi:hypothetical protein
VGTPASSLPRSVASGRAFHFVLLRLNLFEHRHGLREVSVEIAFENFEDFDESGIAEGIEDLVALFPAGHDSLGPQHGEVLGRIGLLELELLDDSAGGHLAIPQDLGDGDSSRMRKRLKNLGFELAELGGQ